MPTKQQNLNTSSKQNTLLGTQFKLATAAAMCILFLYISNSNNGSGKASKSSDLPVETRQKYLDEFLKNPDDVLERLNAAIKNTEWNKATSIGEYYSPTNHPEIIKLHAIAKAGLEAEKLLPPSQALNSKPQLPPITAEKKLPPVKAPSLKLQRPSDACRAMEGAGLITNGWNNRYEDDYGCSSPYKDIGNGHPMPNNLSFYAEGNGSQVNKVKIVLNFNDRSSTKNAYSELQSAAALLVSKFTGSAITPKLKAAIASNSNLSAKINNATVIVEKIDWPSGGYEIQVTVK